MGEHSALFKNNKENTFRYNNAMWGDSTRINGKLALQQKVEEFQCSKITFLVDG